MNAKSPSFHDLLSNTVIATDSLPAFSNLSAKQLVPDVKISESCVWLLDASPSYSQKKVVCFHWNHRKKKNGLLRTHVSINRRVEGSSGAWHYRGAPRIHV